MTIHEAYLQKKKDFFSPENIVHLSIVEDESFVTETLAKIYLQQKNYKKALKAYENLRLKDPKKKRNFADQINSIKELIKKGSH